MGLSPEEEVAFAAIAQNLERRWSAGIPWSVVAVSVAVVGVAVVGALLSGVAASVVSVFCLAFSVGLAVGLLVVALLDRRKRRVVRRLKGRRRAGPRHVGR